jgi:hypothetical protein
LLPELVGDDRHRLTRASALFQAATRLTLLAGPALGGLLIGWLGPAQVLAVDAASYLVAFVLVAGFVPAGGGRPAATGDLRGMLAGVRVLLGDPLLRAFVVSVGLPVPDGLPDPADRPAGAGLCPPRTGPPGGRPAHRRLGWRGAAGQPGRAAAAEPAPAAHRGQPGRAGPGPAAVAAGRPAAGPGRGRRARAGRPGQRGPGPAPAGRDPAADPARPAGPGHDRRVHPVDGRRPARPRPGRPGAGDLGDHAGAGRGGRRGHDRRRERRRRTRRRSGGRPRRRGPRRPPGRACRTYGTGSARPPAPGRSP